MKSYNNQMGRQENNKMKKTDILNNAYFLDFRWRSEKKSGTLSLLNQFKLV